MASSSNSLMLTTSSLIFTAFVFLLSSGLVPRACAQQPYGSAVEDCDNQHNDTGLLGYFCGSGSCETYLTFTARPPYADLASIATLLGVDTGTLAAANSVGEGETTVAAGRKVLVPATCSCTSTPAGRFYQRNATYVAQPGDMLVTIANDAFQGLTTCQALRAQVLGGAAPESLEAGQALPVPLRCACPSAAQAAAGVTVLVTYLLGEFDDVSGVAKRFGVVEEVVQAANEMEPPFTVFPDTTLLVPVTSAPNTSQIQSSPAPPPPPPRPAANPPAEKKRGSHAGVYIGVGVAVAVIASAGAFLALKTRKRRRRAGTILPTTGARAERKEGNKKRNDMSSNSPALNFATTSNEASASLPSDAFSPSVSLSEIKASLKVYSYAELRAATDGFSPARRLGNGSSVYRAEFDDGAAAAVEAVDRDVSAEVAVARKVNHLNLIRLVGLCHHHGRWYLVTELAERGALRDRLLEGAASEAAALCWAERVQVGLDVAEGLRYLHEYADPPCVHMDVTSGTVLLTGGAPLRAKLRGFAAARAISSGAGGEAKAFTMTSRIAGTHGYMAPEYLEHGVVSPKADVYALGVVLLELVTGKGVEDLVGEGVGNPFADLRELGEEQDDGAVFRRVEELVDPALPAGSCPQDAVVMMVRLIERCVRRDAAARPTTGEVAQRLLKMSGASAV